jgi:putative transposase
LICAFIAEHRARFGVASICRVLSEHGCRIAPRTFYAWLQRPLSARALWDLVITEILAGYYEPDDQGRKRPESLYGSVKMWAHLNREGIIVAKCTVERLMRTHGWQGVRRLKRVRTTVSDPAADRAPDLVKRGFRAPAPGRLLVADFTYVRLAGGMFAYTAFVIDAFANRILGWECSTSKQTRFVEAAIRQAATVRVREGHLDAGPVIHHSDAGSQGGFNRSSQHLDHGGVGWDDRGSRRSRRRPGRVGSGLRIGRCGRRCARRAGPSRRELCSGSSGV